MSKDYLVHFSKYTLSLFLFQPIEDVSPYSFVSLLIQWNKTRNREWQWVETMTRERKYTKNEWIQKRRSMNTERWMKVEGRWVQTMETDLSDTIDPREVDMLVRSLKREKTEQREKKRERRQNRERRREREDRTEEERTEERWTGTMMRVSLSSDYSDPSDLVSSLVELLVVFPLDDRMIPESERCFSDDEDPVFGGLETRIFLRSQVTGLSRWSSRWKFPWFVLMVTFARWFLFLPNDNQRSDVQTALHWWHFFGCGPWLHLAATWFANSPQL